MVAEGVARPEDVDGMYRLNLGAPAGPFQLMDLVGLDVALDVENHYVDQFPQLPRGPRDLLRSYRRRRQARHQDRRRFLPLLRWPSASFAALAPHIPWAPGPGGVAAEQMYMPGIPTLYGDSVVRGPKVS